jgi:hypothetical protein
MGQMTSVVAHISTWESEARRLRVWGQHKLHRKSKASLSYVVRLSQKTKGCGCSSVVDHLPIICKDLSSTPSTANNNNDGDNDNDSSRANTNNVFVFIIPLHLPTPLLYQLWSSCSVTCLKAGSKISFSLWEQKTPTLGGAWNRWINYWWRI